MNKCKHGQNDEDRSECQKGDRAGTYHVSVSGQGQDVTVICAQLAASCPCQGTTGRPGHRDCPTPTAAALHATAFQHDGDTVTDMHVCSRRSDCTTAEACLFY